MVLETRLSWSAASVSDSRFEGYRVAKATASQAGAEPQRDSSSGEAQVFPGDEHPPGNDSGGNGSHNGVLESSLEEMPPEPKRTSLDLRV